MGIEFEAGDPPGSVSLVIGGADTEYLPELPVTAEERGLWATDGAAGWGSVTPGISELSLRVLRLLRHLERVEGEREGLRAEGERLRAESSRLQRACDQGLPREVILCPSCGKPHVEGPRHDDPTVDGRKRPHHTHRCYGCSHVWEAVNPDGSPRWSFGVPPAKAKCHHGVEADICSRCAYFRACRCPNCGGDLDGARDECPHSPFGGG